MVMPAKGAKIDAPTWGRFLDLLKVGVYRNVAARACGIPESSVRDWARRGRKHPAGAYGKMLAKMEEAEAQAEADLSASLAQSKSDWAKLQFLARRWPERWSEKQRVEVSGPADGPVEIKQDLEVLRRMVEDPEARQRLNAFADAFVSAARQSK